MLKSANLYVRCLSSILPTRHATMPPCHHAMHWRALASCRAFTRGWLAHPLPHHVQRISCLYPMARAAYTKIFGDENTVCIELPLKHQEVYRFTYFPEFPGPLVSRDRSARLQVSANKTRVETRRSQSLNRVSERMSYIHLDEVNYGCNKYGGTERRRKTLTPSIV